MSKKRELLYLLLVPVGVFLFSVLFDYLNNNYWQQKLDGITEEALVEALKMESVDTEEEYEKFALDRYKFNDIKDNDIRVTILQDEHSSIMISNTIEHFSIYGYVTGQKQYSTSRYKGYMNEYNEPIVEKIEDVFEDDKVEEEKN